MKKIANISKWSLRGAIVLALIYDIYIGHFSGITGGTAVLLLTFVIDFVNNKKRFLSDKLITIYCMFCFFALVLGTMLLFYINISWWDVLMHVFSGIILAFTGNEILCAFQKEPINPFVQFLFVVGFACIGGVFWEIYEFFVDMLLGLDTQMVVSTGINDTMEDLIADVIGGILVGIFYIKQKK
ncbi:MAG: hypothetical protein R3Y09_09870 [Clostridia bacterium]